MTERRQEDPRLQEILDAPRRLMAMRGTMLTRNDDAPLQDLVSRSAAELGFPVALVSLVLRRTQFFRAHVGLPHELAVSRSTDRCLSFCQFAVGSGQPLLVADAAQDASLPQELVRQYGIRAYAGVPLQVDGQNVGTLCVLDVKPHAITERELSRLKELGLEAATRLSELACQDTEPRRLLRTATSPAFLEMRNLLNALHGDVEYMGIALADIEGGMRLLREIAEGGSSDDLRQAAAALHGAIHCWDDLRAVQRNLALASRSLTEHVLSLQESMLEDRDQSPVSEVLRVAAQLAQHATRNVGGLHLNPASHVGAIDMPLSRAAPLLAAALAGLARALPPGARRGIDARAVPADGCIEVVLTAADAEAASYRRVADELEGLAAVRTHLHATSQEDCLRLSWPAR